LNKKLLTLTLLLLLVLIVINSFGFSSEVTGNPVLGNNVANALSSSVSYFKLYNLRVGEGVIVKDKQVKLISFGSNKELTVEVSGVQNTIQLGVKKSINGLDVKNVYVYYIYSGNDFINPSTVSAWLNIRETPKKTQIIPTFSGCKVEMTPNLDLSAETGITSLSQVSSLDITPAHNNVKIRLTKIKDNQKTDVFTKEAWVYTIDDLPSCNLNVYNCDYYRSAIVYKDIKDDRKIIFESLTGYDGDIYINC